MTQKSGLDWVGWGRRGVEEGKEWKREEWKREEEEEGFLFL